MRIVNPEGSEGVRLPGGIRVVFDGFDLILAAGTAIFILASYVDGLRPAGHWVGIVLIAVWVVLTLRNYREV